MPEIAKLNGGAAHKTLAALRAEYDQYRTSGLALDIQRGRPCAEQLDLAAEMLDWGNAPYICEDGNDARNYGGGIEGTPEARKLFADLFGVGQKNVIAWGNSSLNLMYDLLVKAMLSGVCGAEKPWLAQASESGEKLKFLCPVPGYDRHFLMTETFGFEMINIDMGPGGPDMDAVERLTAADHMIKGIWNIPKYQNPTGITYSDETVRRFAALKPKAKDFRIFWDNSYAVHDLYDEPDELLNLLEEAKKRGNEDMVYMFASSSKITFAGGGITALAASEKNITHIAKQLSVQTICSDKLNQLRHVRYIKDMAGLSHIMKIHASLLRPKFELVLGILSEEFRGEEFQGEDFQGEDFRGGGGGMPGDICAWTCPRGGYFISLDAPDGCAKETLRMAAEAGVKFTPAGATFPRGVDPRDRNIRIAPTVPSAAELGVAIKVLALCIKIAYLKSKVQ
ncbi:MAG: aminotransferase [Oscillospiraceae bacterium]|nr:aminotransferase [Oscillospiraceae bacterium]